VLELTSVHRAPAYFVVEEEGEIVLRGGNLEYYGLEHVKPAESTADDLLFLTGVFPIGDEPVSFPKVEMLPGVFADIHIFNRSNQNWVLLLDSSGEVAQFRAVQQHRNDLRLKLERQNRASQSQTEEA
jgi:hypothetical protein